MQAVKTARDQSMHSKTWYDQTAPRHSCGKAASGGRRTRRYACLNPRLCSLWLSQRQRECGKCTTKVEPCAINRKFSGKWPNQTTSEINSCRVKTIFLQALSRHEVAPSSRRQETLSTSSSTLTASQNM